MRQRQNLNGWWRFQTDPNNVGEDRLWASEGLPEATEVEVPHIWQSEAQWLQYSGAAWYEKMFDHEPVSDGQRVYIRFGAVDFHAMVWLNGHFVGEHEGGFTPFEFDLTAWLHDDERANRLVVRVYDPRDNAEIPIGKQGSWYTRVSGIWQEVWLETRSNSYIERVHVFPDIDRKQADVKLSVSGMRSDLLVEYTICDHLEPRKVHHQSSAEVEQAVKAQLSLPNPVLWSPETPHLYDLAVTLKDRNSGIVIDTYTVHFGMRKIEFADGQLLLNDKPLFVRGALDQAFYPSTLYRAPSEDWIIEEIQLAKQMGFNLLRKHIKVEIPAYLYWADRLGMLIWAEPPNVVKWSVQSRRRFYDELRSMIDRDMNHPSIIIWSLYNEEWGLEWDLAGDPLKQEYIEQLYGDIQRLDPTRLICDNSGWVHVRTDINDYHRYFVLPEQTEEWKADLDEYILGHPEANYVQGRKPDGEPIIISEFGVWGLPSVNKLFEYYGGRPPWYANLGDDTHQEDFKKPETATQHFHKYQLDRIFGDMEGLSIASQRRMHRAVKALIEEMRKRPGINGYVVTEFTDVEWETNGWLDAIREKKYGMDQADSFNGALIVIADIDRHNWWSGETCTSDIVISNHSMRNIQGELLWEISDTKLSGRVELNEGNYPHIRLAEAIQFTAPDVGAPGFHRLKLMLRLQGEMAAVNEVELTFSPQEPVPNDLRSVTICPYRLEAGFRTALQQNGLQVEEQMSSADLIITDTLDADVIARCRQGGNVLFLAEEGDRLAEKGFFTFRKLDEGESWNRTSSFNFVDLDFFEGVPLHPEMGWEMERLFPDYIVPFSNYSKLGGTMGRVVHMFGNDTVADTSRIVSGYFQGWIGQVGGSLLVQTCGRGTLIATTWKLLGHYGTHPIATRVVHALIKRLQMQA